MGSDGPFCPGFYGGEHNARLKSELNKKKDEELQEFEKRYSVKDERC